MGNQRQHRYHGGPYTHQITQRTIRNGSKTQRASLSARGKIQKGTRRIYVFLVIIVIVFGGTRHVHSHHDRRLNNRFLGCLWLRNPSIGKSWRVVPSLLRNNAKQHKLVVLGNSLPILHHTRSNANQYPSCTLVSNKKEKNKNRTPSTFSTIYGT